MRERSDQASLSWECLSVRLERTTASCQLGSFAPSRPSLSQPEAREFGSGETVCSLSDGPTPLRGLHHCWSGWEASKLKEARSSHLLQCIRLNLARTHRSLHCSDSVRL